MTAAITQREVGDKVMEFLRAARRENEDLLIDATAPLFKLGLLDSLTTATLLNFIHREFEVFVPVQSIVRANFATVDSIARMVCELANGDSGDGDR